jgi:hypothetical protein
MQAQVNGAVYQFGGGDYAFMSSLPVRFTPASTEQSV